MRYDFHTVALLIGSNGYELQVPMVPAGFECIFEYNALYNSHRHLISRLDMYYPCLLDASAAGGYIDLVRDTLPRIIRSDFIMNSISHAYVGRTRVGSDNAGEHAKIIDLLLSSPLLENVDKQTVLNQTAKYGDLRLFQLLFCSGPIGQLDKYQLERLSDSIAQSSECDNGIQIINITLDRYPEIRDTLLVDMAGRSKLQYFTYIWNRQKDRVIPDKTLIRLLLKSYDTQIVDILESDNLLNEETVATVLWRLFRLCDDFYLKTKVQLTERLLSLSSEQTKRDLIHMACCMSEKIKIDIMKKYMTSDDIAFAKRAAEQAKLDIDI